MKRYIGLFALAMLFLLKVSFAQEVDSLVDFSDIEFVESDVVQDTQVAVDSDTDTHTETANHISRNAPEKSVSAESEQGSLWGIFIGGILGGFAALLMPCIFPMLPLTVSFFTKKSGTRGKAVTQALLYGAFIIFIYVALGMLITIVFGAEALNLLSTNGIFNFLFF